MMKSDPRYVTVESKSKGVEAIKLLETPYSGIIYSYGKVSFDADESNDTLKIKFEYDIHNDAGKKIDPADFEQYIGDLLQDLIREQIATNSITYTGGVDAD
jgi:hypothetical protein